MTATVTAALSRRQKHVLSAIRNHFTEHGYPPSIRDVADATGLCPSGVHYQIGQLQRMGWISRHPNRPRSIVVLDPETGGE